MPHRSNPYMEENSTDKPLEQDKAAAKKAKEERKAAQRAEKEEARARKSEDQRKSREIKREDVSAMPEADNKEKRKSRGVFGRLTEKLRGDKTEVKKEDKANEPPASPAEVKDEPEAGETSAIGALGATTLGVGAGTANAAVASAEASASVDASSARSVKEGGQEQGKGVSSESEVPAGSSGASQAQPVVNEPAAEEAETESSRLSSSDDGNDNRPVASTARVKPALDRHISTIDTSDEGSDSSDDDSESEWEGLAARNTAKNSTAGPSGTQTAVNDDGPASSPPEEEKNAESLVNASPVHEKEGEPKADSAESPVKASPVREKEGESKADSAESPVVASPVREKEGEPKADSADSTGKPQSTGSEHRASGNNQSMPSPEAVTDDQRTTATAVAASGDEKESKSGLRGFFNRFTSRDNSDTKLTKANKGSSSATKPTPNMPCGGGAKLTGGETPTDGKGRQPTKDPVANPGIDAAPLSQQDTSTDAAASAADRSSAGGSDAQRVSVSSFRRHEEAVPNAEDVSSSGREEEDVADGRRGRLAKRLGPKKSGSVAGEKKPEKTSTQVDAKNENDSEALAPPPPVAASASDPTKSASPARETRFQENL